MNGLWSAALVLWMLAPGSAAAGDPTGLTPMPESLETRYALSALPPALRNEATVYRLDPASGYQIARKGSSGLACLVERTQWELGEFRDDLFVPLCYDEAGTRTYLRSVMDTAKLRAQGRSATTVKTLIAKGFSDGTYVPSRVGVSYMYAPVMRTVGPPDMQVRTMSMPHLMVYAPHVTNADLGAKPDLGNPDSLRYPFIDSQGTPAHSYIIVLSGDEDVARILREEESLARELCAWRTILCSPHRMN